VFTAALADDEYVHGKSVRTKAKKVGSGAARCEHSVVAGAGWRRYNDPP
jgi:hypothetical protein